MNPQAQPFVPTQHTWTDDNGIPELLTAARRLLVTSAWHGAVVRKQKDKSTWVIPASSRHGSAPSLTSASRSAAAKGDSSPWAHIDSYLRSQHRYTNTRTSTPVQQPPVDTRALTAAMNGHGQGNWQPRNAPMAGDGGAHAARFPYPPPPPPQYGGYQTNQARNNTALRGGVHNNFVPRSNGGPIGYPPMNSGGTMNGSMASGHSSLNGSTYADDPYVTRRPDSALGNDMAVQKTTFVNAQTPPGRVNSVPRRHRDSFGSNGTFATQIEHPMSPTANGNHYQATHPQMRPTTQIVQHRTNGGLQQFAAPVAQRRANIGQQLHNAIDPNVHGIVAGLGNMQMSHTSAQSESNGSTSTSVGFPAHYNQEGTARTLAEMIKRAETEDPYDRKMALYTTAPRQPNPTLGPARFKDSRMFATIGGSSSIIPPNQALGPVKKGRPDWLDLALEGNMTPDLEEAFDALPFDELCRGWSNHHAGVVRIKDIPYATTRQEMTAFLGRNAQIVRQPEGSPFHAIHILMERESGKTMDCFVEVATPAEASWVARQFARRVDQKRPPKVGDRTVEVVYSSQDELMFELFPRAKHVRWSNGQPVVDRNERKYYKDQAAVGFQGFLHPEELVALSKHATLHERSPFASKSPCRVYEAMITLLFKYPWQAIDEITVAERRAIYDACIGLIKTLIVALRRSNLQHSANQPTPGLLQELTTAALVCPGFTEKQKASIIAAVIQGGFKGIADGRDLNVKLGGHHEFSASWPFSALGIPMDVELDVLAYYARLFREATYEPKATSLAALKAKQASGQGQNPMGEWSIYYGNNPSSLTLAQVGQIEYDAVEKLLKFICDDAPAEPRPHNSHSAPGSIGRQSSSSGGSGSAGQRSNATYHSLF
ncbi:hypothetical protein CKM354_000233700 [Cercospora kikuchii]|uniref:RRM domain-containing protein n=1 Tax=Cercospora kikuchii TaxID=84275 RepID=A0A9P3FDW0_9PEZI|nr:uncharacterized protein CKM354_000233700 [Cercospora kikuchii]GIZ38940.1 hypothetical protein CKM354_000233700 [Cercospora kikuchii]